MGRIARAFKENPYDIAGLIDIRSFEREDRQKAFNTLKLWTKRRSLRSPKTPEEEDYARILLALLTVAQEDYGEDTGFYTLLEKRFEEQAGGHAGLQFHIAGNQKYQQSICELYQRALNHFGYSVPKFTEGRAYSELNALLFHAGLPGVGACKAAKLALQIVRCYGAEAEFFTAEDRADILQASGLNANDRRLLTTPIYGSDDLWSYLCHTALVWEDAYPDRLDDACREIREQCPPSINPDQIEKGFQEITAEQRDAQRQAVPYPFVRFHAESGAVLLHIPEQPVWSIVDDLFQSGGKAVFSQNAGGKDLLLVLPPAHPVKLRAMWEGRELDREFDLGPERPSESPPGLWFSERGGRYIDPRQTRFGVRPGHYFVILPNVVSLDEGEPLPLYWEHLRTGNRWTAWRVDVEETRSDRFALTMSGIRREIRRANRGGRRLQMLNVPVAVADLGDDDILPVFDRSPEVRSANGEIMKISSAPVRLFEKLGDRLERTIGTLHEDSETIPAERGGVFQIRRLEGIGQLLDRFAVVPGLAFHQSGDLEQPRLQVSVSQGTLTSDRTATPECQVLSTTVDPVNPYLPVVWRSKDRARSVKVLIPVTGVRWRLIDVNESAEPGEWRKRPVIFTRHEAAVLEPVIELEIPRDSRLDIEGSEKPPRKRSTASGDRYRLSLLKWDFLVVRVDGGDPVCLGMKTDRPQLETIGIHLESRGLVIRWRGRLPEGSQWLFWNPLRPDRSFIRFDARGGDHESGEFRVATSDIGINGPVAIAVARTAPLSLAERLRIGGGELLEFGNLTDRPGEVWFDWIDLRSESHPPPESDSLTAFTRAMVQVTAAMATDQPSARLADCSDNLVWKRIPIDHLCDLMTAAVDPAADSPAARCHWSGQWLRGFAGLSTHHVDYEWARVIGKRLNEGISIARLLRSPLDPLRVHWSNWMEQTLVESDGVPFQMLHDLWTLSVNEQEALNWSKCFDDIDIPPWGVYQSKALARVLHFLDRAKMQILLHQSPVVVSTWLLKERRFQHESCCMTRTWKGALGIDEWTVKLVEPGQRRLGPEARPWDHDICWEARWEPRYLRWTLTRPWYEPQEHNGAFFAERPKCELSSRIGSILDAWDLTSVQDRTLNNEWLQFSQSIDPLRLLGKEGLLPIHREVLAQVSRLDASSQNGLNSEHPEVTDGFRLAWSCVWATVYRQRGYLPEDVSIEQLNRALAACCEAVPQFTERLFVLAELICIQRFGRGLGCAVRYPG